MYQLRNKNLADSVAIYGRGRELFRPPTYICSKCLTLPISFFLLCCSPSSESPTGLYRYVLQPVNFRSHSTVNVHTLNIKWWTLNTEAASSNLSRRACHELQVNTRHYLLITAT